MPQSLPFPHSNLYSNIGPKKKFIVEVRPSGTRLPSAYPCGKPARFGIKQTVHQHLEGVGLALACSRPSSSYLQTPDNEQLRSTLVSIRIIILVFPILPLYTNK
jgi:hypothetical protein